VVWTQHTLDIQGETEPIIVVTLRITWVATPNSPSVTTYNTPTLNTHTHTEHITTRISKLKIEVSCIDQ
jgi:hypothetical protein